MATGTLALTNTTFAAGTTAVGSDVITNFNDILDYINNRNDGTDEWQVLNVTATVDAAANISSNQATTVLDINNTATDGDPTLSWSLSGTAKFSMGVDDGDSDAFKAGLGAIGTTTWLRVPSTGAAVELPVGAAALPSITFIGDVDTGFYRSAANTIGISSNGAEQFTIATNITSTNPGATTGRILVGDGAQATPSYSFASDVDSGFYYVAANNIGIVAGNTAVGNFSTTRLQMNLPIYFADGAVGAPSVTFSTDTNSGIYSIGADQIGIATAGALQFGVYNGGVYVNGQIQASAGIAGAPGYTFQSDTDCGIYRIGADNIGIATAGTKAVDIDSSQNVDVSAGNLTIPAAKALFFDGGGDTYISENSANNIRCLAGGDVGWNVQDTGVVTQPNQPSFLVTDGTGASNVTGDTTVYTELWPTEVYDLNADFASNTFTAPVTGKYLLSVAVRLDNIADTHDYRTISLVTSNRTYSNTYNITLAETSHTLQLEVLADMDANDTAYITISVGSVGKTVDIQANASYNYFSGSLIN